MITIAEALRGVSAYPIPARTLAVVAAKRDLDVHEEVSPSILGKAAYHLCVADLLMWLSEAPDISQGGQTYSFTDEQRADMRRRAGKLYDDYDESASPCTTYGYKGTNL